MSGTVSFCFIHDKSFPHLSLCISDVAILSEKYPTEFQGRHVEDIPESEYLLAVAGFAK